MEDQLIKRFKSLVWRFGVMFATAVIAFAIDNATDLNIPTYVVVILGLINGEITKYLNSGQ